MVNVKKCNSHNCEGPIHMCIISFGSLIFQKWIITIRLTYDIYVDNLKLRHMHSIKWFVRKFWAPCRYISLEALDSRTKILHAVISVSKTRCNKYRGEPIVEKLYQLLAHLQQFKHLFHIPTSLYIMYKKYKARPHFRVLPGGLSPYRAKSVDGWVVVVGQLWVGCVVRHVHHAIK